MKRESIWNKYNETQLKELETLSQNYKKFLDEGKTERECVNVIVDRVEKEGYVELNRLIKEKGKVQEGDKIYAVNKGKAVALFVMGKNKLEDGMKIIGGQICHCAFSLPFV